MYCSKCGTAIPQNAAFCAACGQQVPNPTSPQPPTYLPPAQTEWQTTTGQLRITYAGFWLRVAAAIIDGIVLAIPLAPFFFIFFASLIPAIIHTQQTQDPMEIIIALLPRLMLYLLLVLLGSWLYWSLLESSAWQATLGKKALGLYVTDISGQRVTFARASGRFFAGRGLGYVPSIGGLYFLISCICAGVTEKKQALHDMIAGCLVLRKI